MRISDGSSDVCSSDLGLPHADQAGAAAGRVEDHVGHLPAELFGEFQAHRLLALDPVRLLQGRGVEPAHLGAALAAGLPAIVDIAVHAPDSSETRRVGNEYFGKLSCRL